MEEEDEDFYAPDEPTVPSQTNSPRPVAPSPTTEAIASTSQSTSIAKTGVNTEELEQEEEMEDEDDDGEDSDSDIDIITERTDGSKPEPPPQTSRYNTIRTAPTKATPSPEIPLKPPPQARADTETAARTTSPPALKSGADYPEVRTSKIDANAKPRYDPAGKPLEELNIDQDLKEKPWRVPGTDMTDFFNYGFDEFTWSLYCLKQEKSRAEAQEDKKGFSMVMDGPMAMPGMPPGPGGAPPGMNMPPMPGMGDMGGPDMMAQMAQMAQMMGMDPSQMDPAMFGMQQPGGGQGGGNQMQGNQMQGFGGGGQQGYGPQGQNQQQQQQQPGYGFDASMMGGDANRNRQANMGGRGGRGGGNRRNW